MAWSGKALVNQALFNRGSAQQDLLTERVLFPTGPCVSRFPFLFYLFPWWLLQQRRPRFDPWVRKILWRRKWQPTPVFFPGKSHGGRNLVGYSPWGCKESDTTERLHFPFPHSAGLESQSTKSDMPEISFFPTFLILNFYLLSFFF